MGRFGALARLRGLGRKRASSYPKGRLGIQDAGTGGDGAMSDLYRDRGQQGEWRTAASGYYLPSADGLGGTVDHDGYINQLNPGDTYAVLSLKAVWADPGDYVITYPAGMGCSLLSSASKTLGAETIVGGTATRILHVPLVQEVGGGNAGDLHFSGIPTGRTSTTLQLRPTIIKVGDTETDREASHAYEASLAALGSKVLRTMDWRSTNANLNLYDYPRINTAPGVPGIKFFVDICNRLDMDLWLNMNFYMTDAACLAEFDYIARNLKPGLHLYVEWMNEIWNSGSKFNAHWAEAALQGVLAGFATSATTAGAVPLPPPTYPISGNVNANSGVPSRSFVIGDTVFGNISGIGVQMWRALQNITSGDPAAACTSASNSYWAVDVNASASGNARARYYSSRSAHMSDLAYQAFAAAGADSERVRPVIAWQNGSSIETGSASFIRLFDGNMAARKWRHHAVAPYYGPTLGNYASGHIGTWNAANKALYTTDLAACLNAYFDPSAAPLLATNIVTGFSAQVDALARASSVDGLPVGYMTMCCYEFGPSNNILGATGSNAWTNTTAALALANAIQQDPRTAAIWNTYISGILALGGPACWYARVGTLPWQIQNDETDHSSLSFLSVAAHGGV